MDRSTRTLLMVLVSSLPGLAGAGESTPRPRIVIERPGQCVAPVEQIRRTHMDMLKHQRDRTVREGVRGQKVSLNACVECHASKGTGSVLGSADAFCQGCHAYAAVKLDCFECHSSTVARPAVARQEAPR